MELGGRDLGIERGRLGGSEGGREGRRVCLLVDTRKARGQQQGDGGR